MIKGTFNYIFLTIIFFVINSNCTQTLPSKNFVFDSKFVSLYRSISSRDSIFFENAKDGIDTFVLTKIDSVISNRINCFMCPKPSKSVFRKYYQVLSDSKSESTIKSQNEVNFANNEETLITITFSPIDTTNIAYIMFKNFRCRIINDLGNQMPDSLFIDGALFTNYYILNSTAPSFIVNQTDVQAIFVTLTDGIIGYKEKSGRFRKRIFLYSL